MTRRQPVAAVLSFVNRRLGRDRVAGQRQRTPGTRGRPLGDVLRELQATGLNIVFSSEIVRPTMKVLTEPKAVQPRKILDEILRPHGLQVQSGPGGALLVVRLREQASPRCDRGRAGRHRRRQSASRRRMRL